MQPFKCKYPECDKSFADRTNVKRHEQQHLNREVDNHGNEVDGAHSADPMQDSGDSGSINSSTHGINSVKFEASPLQMNGSINHLGVDSPLFSHTAAPTSPQRMLRLLSNVTSNNMVSS